MEVEIKFTLPNPATFERLRGLKVLGGYRLESVSVKQVRDRYLDTDDRAILQSGYACRVRCEGDEQIATLKGLGQAPGASGMHRRVEHEVPVTAEDPATWPPSPARDLALSVSEGKSLQLLFVICQERHVIRLYPGDSQRGNPVAELCLDRVQLDLQGQVRPDPYFELEIELLDQGKEADLRALAAELETAWGLQPQPLSKFERALAWVDAARRRSRRETSMEEALTTKEGPALSVNGKPVSFPLLDGPNLSPDDPMSEAGRKTLWFHFLRMLKHEPGTRAGEDIEELHRMRVATRRMRAAIRVFGDFFEPKVIKKFNKGVRRVTRALGPVRDLDVFEEKARRYLNRLPEAEQDSLDPLLESWRAERKAARAQMLAFLDSDRYHAFKREFAEFLQTEGAGARAVPPREPVAYRVCHVAPRLIYTRYGAVRAYETVLAEPQVETLHALRIDCKYLRYTLEFLRQVLGLEVESVIKEIKIMQDHLGDLNDAQVAIGLLGEFLSAWEAAQVSLPVDRQRGAEGIVTYMAARQEEKRRLMTTFPEAWARLNREKVRRWLALSVAAL